MRNMFVFSQCIIQNTKQNKTIVNDLNIHILLLTISLKKERIFLTLICLSEIYISITSLYTFLKICISMFFDLLNINME